MNLRWMLREELVTALLRTLPKQIRKEIAPLPERARRVVEALAEDEPHGPALGCAPLATLIAERLRSDLGVAVHGQSYGKPAVEDDLAAGYPDREAGALNIGLLHTCATGRPGHAPYAPCSVETLVDRGYDY